MYSETICELGVGRFGGDDRLERDGEVSGGWGRGLRGGS